MSGSRRVTVNESVTVAQLVDGNLLYQPSTDGYGTGYDGFTFAVSGSTETSNSSYTMTIDVTGVNDPATGMPAISGSAEGRRTLTASTAGIADPDGLSRLFSYQWKRYDADGTTFEADIGTDLNTYKLTGDEVGKTVKVAVSFTDSGGGSEERVSAAFPSSGTVGLSMLVSNNEQGDDDEVTLRSVDHGQPFTTGGAAPSYNVTGVTVTSEDPEGDAFALQICDVDRYSQPTTTSTTCTDLTPPGSFVAGPLTFTVPTSSTLTLYSGNTYMVMFPKPGEDVLMDSTDSDSEDTDSLPNWSIRDSLMDEDTAGWSNFPTGESVRITIHGTANSASSTAPTAMDNSVTTSEDTPYSFTPADFRFSATGGSDTLASVRIRTLPANPPLGPSESKPAGGEFTLDGSAVTANQSVTRDQLAAGSLAYTPRADDSGSDYTDFLFLVSGGSEESSFAYKMTINVTAVNDPATGAPDISGTPEVGETLTALTAGIADVDGLPSSFTYRWMQVDSDGTSNPTNIMGATSSTYTLTNSEEGKRIKVEVSFTDDDGNDETRTSAAFPSSGTVIAPNTAPTASNSTVTATEDETYTFLADDFNYSDVDDDPLVSVKITGLPAASTGLLRLNSTRISEGATVSADEADRWRTELRHRPTTRTGPATRASGSRSTTGRWTAPTNTR